MSPPATARAGNGWINALIGILIFSASLPATRLAVLQLDPLFVTFTRAAVAGGIGLCVLALGREPRPRGADLGALVLVAFGVVLGFPLLSALALRHMTSAHAMLFVGLLPASTAAFAVLRAGERPRPAFWLFAAAGAALVAGYALAHGGAEFTGGDSLMIAAVIVCGLGYAEGARLSRRLGGWQVICWALLLALPVMAPLAFIYTPRDWSGVGWPAIGGLAYVSVFSMLIGFVFWYRGLASGGIAAVAQLQLAQPFFGLLFAAALLGEPVGPGLVAVLAGVVACVAGARRYAVRPVSTSRSRFSTAGASLTPVRAQRGGRTVRRRPARDRR